MGKAERLESFGNKETMNFNEILYQNVQASQYLKNLRCVRGRAKGARRRARDGNDKGRGKKGAERGARKVTERRMGPPGRSV